MLDTSASLDLRQVSRLIGDAVPADRWTPPPGLLSWPCGQERRSGVCTWRSAWWSSLRRGERGAGRRIARYQKGGLGPRVSPPDVRGRGRGSSSFGTPKADPSTQAWTPRFAHRSLPGRVYPRPMGKRILEPSLSARRLGGISHAMQAEGDVVRLPAAQEGPPDFAAFFADERAGLLKLLYFVALNGSRMRARAARRAARRLVGLAPSIDPFDEVNLREDVRQMLLELSPRQRAALVLLDMYGYGSEEAARILGVRASTVRALASQGRAVLRALGGPRA